MENRTIMWIVIGALFVSALFLTYKASNLSGNAVSASGNIDTTGWTANEIMNYEMHGTIPARLQGKLAASTASNQMVGGC